jgi:microsomal dipeptidase-like Zn-dependent dipeptidase
MVSPAFEIKEPYLALLIGGGGQAGTRVGLRIEGQPGAWAREEHGTGQLQMGRITWDVRNLHGRVGQVVVEDRAGEGIVVDDIFDSAEPPVSRPPPVWGFADTHTHPVAQLGFGQHVFVGGTDGPIADALKDCRDEHGDNGDGGKAGIVIGGVETSFNRIFGHRTKGYPGFDGWPRWSTLVHQQMYIDWIERAWRGGLRLLVAHVNNDEQLAANTHGTTPYDDMNVTEAELEELTALAKRHDKFMEIAPTPADARRIIASGRLAVVLGVEVDAIGGCRRDEDCDEQKAIEAIDYLHTKGARHVFPVHLADNAFGGAAVWYNGIYDLLTWYLRGDYQTIESDPSVAFTLSPAHQWYPVWFASLTFAANRYGGRPYQPPFDAYGKVSAGHVNARGMTRVGRAVLREMRRLGMIVDIDHMGERARADTLGLFAESSTPVVMGHTWFRDLGYDQHETQDWLKLRNDIMKTADEVEAVRKLGGVVSPITNQHDVRRVEGSGTGNDCEGASTSWLQAFVYAVQRMGGAGVPVGTDFNGLPGQPLPRFGPYACTGREMTDGGNDWPRRAPGLSPLQTVRADADAQDVGVTYDVPIRYAWTNRFYGPRVPRDDPYTPEERAVWIAMAECKAGVDPRRAPDSDLQDGQLPGSARARTWSLPREVVGPVASGLCGGPQIGLRDWWQAATLVRAGGPRPDASGLRRKYDLIAGIDSQWKRMESGNPDHPLERFFYDEARQHDADVNLDGLAHYGLLPDFFQDVANQLKKRGAEVKDLSALFRSAETYLEMWERVEASAGK